MNEWMVDVMVGEACDSPITTNPRLSPTPPPLPLTSSARTRTAAPSAPPRTASARTRGHSRCTVAPATVQASPAPFSLASGAVSSVNVSPPALAAA